MASSGLQLHVSKRALLLLAFCLVIWNAVGVSGNDEVDEHLEFISVKPVDREKCSSDLDCEDWCMQDRNSTRCGCRCPSYTTEGDFSCKSSERYCQLMPRHFWGGSFNSTAKSIKKECKKHINLMVIFTATSCLHCPDFEPAYRWSMAAMKERGVEVARIDVDKNKEFADEHGVTSLPAIKFFHKCKDKGLFKGTHSKAALEAYVKKVTDPVTTTLRSSQDVEAFSKAHPVSVIGFFANPSGESDEIDDFSEAAAELQYTHNTYFAIVRDRNAMAPYMGKADSLWFKKSPSTVIFRNIDGDEQERDTLLMSELNARLQDWIMDKSVRLVDEITSGNFVYYESLRRPMLLLFLDKDVNNRALLKSIKAVANRYKGVLSCGWLDGKMYAGKMAALGLKSDHLPALAINTMQNGRFAFPSTGKLNEGEITIFVQDFIAGRLNPGTEKAKEAMKVTEKQVGNDEFDSTNGGIGLTRDNFAQTVLEDTTHDVVVLFYTSTQQLSKDFLIFWKKTRERFNRIKIKSVKLFRYDVATHQVPRDIEFEQTPAIMIFPAKDKKPPYKTFHGKGKVRPIMYWIQESASIPFEFPNDTPHLDDEQREAYLVQIKDRDNAVLQRRQKEKEERIAKLQKNGEL